MASRSAAATNVVKTRTFKEPSLKAPTPQGAIENTNVWSTRQLVVMALMCAIGVLLSLVEFPLVPAAPFLKYDASLVPAMVCGFAYGPAAGLAVGAVGAIIHGILFADFTGAVMNILVVAGFVLPASLVYARTRKFKLQIAGLVLGVMGALAAAVAGNLVLTPMYMGVPLQAVVDMLIPVLIPFNLLKGVLNAALTLVIFKSIEGSIAPKSCKPRNR